MYFAPPLAAGRELLESYKGTPLKTTTHGHLESVFTRKAAMSYGWDIAPEALSMGIWRPVRLIQYGPAHLRDLVVQSHLASNLRSGRVEVAAEIDIDSPLAKNLVLEARLYGGPKVVAAARRKITSAGAFKVLLKVKAPRLWWPRQLGHAHLYRLEVRLLSGPTVLDHASRQVGFRRVELLLKDPGSQANTFRLRVNGQDVFVKGTNWIPLDAWFPRVTQRRYDRVLDLAVESNCQMIRVWGGGVYEDPYFYRKCDELGLMVWQDFMYSCALYPQRADFLKEAHREAEIVVKSLLHHPSVVIWCGGNEVDGCYHRNGRPYRDFARDRIFNGVLPEAVRAIDTTRPYVPSCPYNPSLTGAYNDACEGDVHLWNHAVHSSHPLYRDEAPLFVSEIGRVACPHTKTLQAVIPPERLFPPGNRSWDDHFGSGRDFHPRRRLAMEQAIRAYGWDVPKNLPDYIRASQVMQALFTKDIIEHFRRLKPHCWGLLHWNLFDNWPQCSDALVDYYGRKKPAFPIVQNLYRPVIAGLQKESPQRFSLWIVNDDYREVAGGVQVQLRDLRHCCLATTSRHFRVAANSSSAVAEWDLDAALFDPQKHYFFMELTYGNHHFRNFHVERRFPWRQVKDWFWKL